MTQNISIQKYYSIILYSYQLKNTSNILVALLGFTQGNLMKCQKKILKMSLNFAPIFINHYALSEINFNGHCLINNNISTPKNVNVIYIYIYIYIYHIYIIHLYHIIHTKSMA